MIQAVITSKTSELLEELEEALRGIYGDDLRGLYLYGSHARQQQDPQSDVDVIILLKDFADYWREIQNSVGEQMRWLLALMASKSADDMRNNVEFLSTWRGNRH